MVRLLRLAFMSSDVRLISVRYGTQDFALHATVLQHSRRAIPGIALLARAALRRPFVGRILRAAPH